MLIPYEQSSLVKSQVKYICFARPLDGPRPCLGTVLEGGGTTWINRVNLCPHGGSFPDFLCRMRSFPPKWHPSVIAYCRTVTVECPSPSLPWSKLSLTIIFICIEFEDEVFESSASETKIYTSTHKFGVKGSPWEEAADGCLLNLGNITRIHYKVHTWLTKTRLENRTDYHTEVRKSDSWSRWRCR